MDRRTHPTRRRRRAAAAVAAVLVAAAGLGTAGGPAEAQAAPAVVTVTATGSTYSSIQDCRGATRATAGPDATFTVTRTGATTDPLVVDVGYTGDLTEGLPDPVTIPAGATSATLTMPARPVGPGTVDLGLPGTGPGPEYVVGTPNTATATIQVSVGDLACNLGDSPVEEQTISRGSAPAAVDLDDLLYTDTSGATVDIEGTLPPGVTFAADGTWAGTATEVGDFAFTAYFCDDEGFCFDELRLIIHVITPSTQPPNAPPPAVPPGTPPPARAVPGTPALTG